MILCNFHCRLEFTPEIPHRPQVHRMLNYVAQFLIFTCERAFENLHVVHMIQNVSSSKRRPWHQSNVSYGVMQILNLDLYASNTQEHHV